MIVSRFFNRMHGRTVVIYFALEAWCSLFPVDRIVRISVWFIVLDPVLSPPWPGFDSLHANLLFLFSKIGESQTRAPGKIVDYPALASPLSRILVKSRGCFSLTRFSYQRTRT